MQTRRELLERAVPAAVGAALIDVREAVEAASAFAATRATPDEAAADEALWVTVQRAFPVDRSIVNLNNGGVSPASAAVQAAMRRYLEIENAAPAYTLWEVLEPQREEVRAQLAEEAGCDAEEVAITRNTSEGLEACQFGLDLQRGDEVIASDLEYPRMLAAFRQRERRDGIVLKTFSVPVPAGDPDRLVALYESQITERTRAILVSHMVYLTGEILPVKAIAAVGRRHRIPVLVDGAHSFAQLDMKVGELGADVFASSLHKWLSAPHGTGLLVVKRERIRDFWPLYGPPEGMESNIRKFEEIGTHPAANALAVADALAFHRAIGPARKEARLRYLRDRWARRLAGRNGVRFHTGLAPGESCALATFELEGVDPKALAAHLFDAHRILVAAIEHPRFRGIRVSPSVYSTLDEIDRFSEAIERVLRSGLPA